MEKGNIVRTVAYILVLKIEFHDVPIFLKPKTKMNWMTLQRYKQKKGMMNSNTNLHVESDIINENPRQRMRGEKPERELITTVLLFIVIVASSDG